MIVKNDDFAMYEDLAASLTSITAVYFSKAFWLQSAYLQAAVCWLSKIGLPDAAGKLVNVFVAAELRPIQLRDKSFGKGVQIKDLFSVGCYFIIIRLKDRQF